MALRDFCTKQALKPRLLLEHRCLVRWSFRSHLCSEQWPKLETWLFQTEWAQKNESALSKQSGHVSQHHLNGTVSLPFQGAIKTGKVYTGHGHKVLQGSHLCRNAVQ